MVTDLAAFIIMGPWNQSNDFFFFFFKCSLKERENDCLCRRFFLLVIIAQ